MPQPKRWPDNAAKMRAYRARRAAKEAEPATTTPAPSNAGPRPHWRYWSRLTASMQQTAETLQDDLSNYLDARSDAWRDGARGDYLQSQLDTVAGILESLESLEWEYPE